MLTTLQPLLRGTPTMDHKLVVLKHRWVGGMHQGEQLVAELSGNTEVLERKRLIQNESNFLCNRQRMSNPSHEVLKGRQKLGVLEKE